MKKPSKKRNLFLAALLSLGLLMPAAGCGKRPPLTDVTQNDGTGTGGTGGYPDGGGGGYADPGGGLPWDQNGDNQTDLPQQPLDIPEPLPAPKKPVKKGDPIIAKAVSYTTAFALPQISNLFRINGVYVYIHLTWQPVIEASEYWLYKGRLPHFEEARRETAYAVIKAGQSMSGFKDGLEPPDLSNGNLWNKIRQGFKMISMQPGIPYQYKVVAADANGIPLTESKLVTSTPLPPVTAATLDQPTDLNTINPLFGWKDGSQNGTRPDGYYVSVFSSVDWTKGQMLPTSAAFWATYRKFEEKNVRYGNDSSNLASYPGTMPFNIVFNLQPGRNYSWTVISVKTDTNNMKTATAISRSWSGFGHFQIDPKAQSVNANRYNSNSLMNIFRRQQPAPRQPVPRF